MEKQKWWSQGSGLADLQEKIDTASCGEEWTGDCPRPCKEPTDGLYVTQGGGGMDALDWKGPQRRPQQWLDRRLEEIARTVGGGYC